MNAIATFIFGLLLTLGLPIRAQPDIAAPKDKSSFTYQAFGTGNTTGHIATLIVKNNLPEEVMIAAQSFFLPALPPYQSYVGRIPAGIIIPAGEAKEIAITGFCTDVTSAPVPLGKELLPVKDWLPIEPEPAAVITGTVAILPHPPLAAFTRTEIGYLTALPGFSSKKNSRTSSAPITYPGSTTPIGGTFAIDQYPTAIAPLLVAVVQKIESATPLVQQNYDTPYSGDPRKEREAIIQQSIWIYVAKLTGETYTKENFSSKVYAAYEHRTGTVVTQLPQEQQTKINAGIDIFWAAFTAAGVAANLWQ